MPRKLRQPNYRNQVRRLIESVGGLAMTEYQCGYGPTGVFCHRVKYTSAKNNVGVLIWAGPFDKGAMNEARENIEKWKKENDI